jgi:chorismate mutase
VHPDPDNAWSDAAQQITPAQFLEMKEQLIFRQPTTDDMEFLENLEHLRHEIDELDEEMLNLLSNRMRLAERIGEYKQRNNIAILQSSRWNEILERAVTKGKLKGLSEEFVTVYLKAVHQESINHQEKVMNRPRAEA